MLALFPFEPPLYEAAGVPVTFVGHPLAQAAARHGSRRETRERAEARRHGPVFALLPGSRASELDMHGDLVLQTAAAIHAAQPDARFLVPLATRPTRDRFEAALYRLGLEQAADDAALRPRGRRAARRRRRARRVRHRDARGGARALPARDLLPRDAAHLRGSSRASCCCPGSGCPTCSPAASSCPSCCRTTRRSTTSRRRRSISTTTP